MFQIQKKSFLCIVILFTSALAIAAEVRTADEAPSLGDAAQQYVHLGLELGQYDKDYVDAYLGPEEWKTQATNPRTKEKLAHDIAALLDVLRTMSFEDSEQALRQKSLFRNVRAMDVRMRMVNGEKFSFDDEARLIYDVKLPEFDFSKFDQALERIAALLPGEGDLASRVDSLRSTIDIPQDALKKVVVRTLEECRLRTKKHISMPDAESFTLEYVTGKSWGGYNWYQGKSISLMQINQDFPTKIDTVVGLGCHEGYPGHHVWNVLIEETLIKDRGWVEFNLYPLFSPYGLIAEGSAEYGVSLAFPDKERTKFERDVLYPLAGLDVENADLIDQISALFDELQHARIAIAKQYRDGEISREEAVKKNVKYALVSEERAESMIAFVEQYGAYVLNYSIGENLIEAYINRKSANATDRWANFEKLLVELSTASDLLE